MDFWLDDAMVLEGLDRVVDPARHVISPNLGTTDQPGFSGIMTHNRLLEETCMALQPSLRYSVMEYLTMERAACERHEYLDGHVYAMAGESPAHGQICVNLIASLQSQLRGGPCQMFTQNMTVRCESPLRRAHASKGLYAYPDLVVVCGAMQFHDAVQDVLLNPTLLVEVLSPSTEGYDRGDKFRRYRTWLPTLTDYVLVDQAQPAIDHFHRTPGASGRCRRPSGLRTGCTSPRWAGPWPWPTCTSVWCFRRHRWRTKTTRQHGKERLVVQMTPKKRQKNPT
jgi:Uma2 family endonuclease